MPTYDYQCQDCGHVFEVFASFKQKEAGLQPECPECHSDKTQQTFRPVMFIGHSPGGEPASTPVSGSGPLCGPGCC